MGWSFLGDLLYAFKKQKTEKDNETVRMDTQEKWEMELEKR